MSDAELSVDEVTLPIKRTEGETLADRLTDNAYQNILPARYLRKDADGELVEGQEDLFERVAKNIALAEAVYEARNQDVEITVTPDQLKPDHPRRDELAEEVFGKGTSLSDDAETTLSVYNVNKFAYETVVPELPADVREHVEETTTAFQDLMEDLSFMPNCVPPASRVAAQGGLKPLGDIEPGERVYDDQDGTARVDSKFENGEKLVTEIETESGYTVQATPEHYFRVISASGEYEWRQVKDLQPDDVIALQKNFLDDEGTTASLLPPMAADGGTVAAETTDFGRPRGDIDMPASMTPALAEWLGLYVGDGTARESGVRVAFDEQDDDLVEYWGELTESVFGFEPTTRHRNDAACVVGQAGRRDLYDYLDQNDLLKDASKTAAVPDAVLESGRTCIETFLSGLFEADGTVGERAIELYTHSELLADQVQKLLLGLGIRSSVSEKRDGYRVTIRKNVCGKRFVERVGFLSERKQTDAKRFENVAENATSIEIPNQTDRLHEWFQQSDLGHDAYRDLSQFLIDPDSEHHQEIGVGIFRRYAEKYPELWNSPVAEFVERDQFYERVSTVDDVGRMAVEDMQVPRRNTYVVEGFVSHNSPTLMNAGDELQQLSACFVDSPEDDIDDIHQTAKEAAQVFQCLTDDTNVYVEGKGVVSIADVEPGDRIVQRNGDDHQVRNVDETHAYDDSPVNRVETEAGVELTGTPNHKLLVDGDWTRVDEIEPGDTLSLRLDWIDDVDATTELTTVAGGAQWVENRTVSNDDILELYADGHSDYEIADRLDSSASTIQRRRSLELGLDPNGSGGRPGGNVSFDESEFEALYDGGHSDGEIAKELGVSTRSVARYRQNNSLDANGEAVKVVDQPTELTPALAELVGMWVGDGSKHEDGIRFHLNREETLEHADRLARDLFDVGLDWRWDEGCYEAVVHSHEVKRWWLANFGDAKPDATSASVPESVQQADRETIGAFLRGLYSTDGSLQKDVYPRLWSSSAELIDDVQQLLLGLGVPAIKWEYDTEDRDYFNVGPTGGQGLEQFQDLIGFVDSRSETMAETLASIDSEGPSVGTRDGSTWHVPVEAVEDAGTATVYDVTVADNHEYVASSVVSHNSGGGMGYAFWRLRPYGDAVGSTGGIASGPITFMRTYDQMCETIAQGGARRGAQMGVMRVSHPDVIQFIHAKNKDVSLARTLRLNDPDDFTHNSFADALEEARELIDDEGRVPEHLRNAVEGHLSNFNISVGITDDFMDALQNDEAFTFTNPRTGEAHIVTEETKELYDMFGLGEYVEVGEELSIPAAELWDDIVEGAHENGEPGVIYLERANKEHSFDVEENPNHRILATNPCGEQPLEEYEACNLGHINLSTLAAGDAPDWRVWSERHADDYDDFDAAVEAYLEAAIDVEELEYRIETATRFLENVVTMSDFPVEKIEEKVRNMRKIGLGIMGLAQLFIQLGVKYGSDEGDAIARQVMQKINHDSKWASHELAEERGVFNDWEDSKYADPTEYREWFEHYVGEDADDWAEGFPIRNHNTTTIAPTGTTSMVGNTTGGCEPVYNVAYYKNVSDDVQGDEMLVEFDDYFLRVLEENGIDVDAVKQEAQEQMAANEFDGVEGLSTVPDAIGELFVTTGDLSPNQHASIQCTLQDGVDSAISKCLEEGTLVQTDSGVRPIESFADEEPEPGEFTDVDEDVTIDGVQVESQYYAGEKDATRVRVDNGTEIVGATDSHKVLTPSGWTVLGDLQPGDHVVGRHVESHGEGGASIDAGPVCDVAFDGGTATVVGNSSRSPHEKDVTLPDRMSPRLAKFLGMYAADGSAIDPRYGVEISTASKAVRDEARELFEELFDREPTVEEDTRRGDERKTVYGVQLNSKPVWEFVTELCGSGAYEKRVPRTVLRGGPDEKLAFVNGVTLDGYVSSQSLVVYGGMSERLADGVAELLRSFGVPKVYVGTKWVKESSAYAYQVHVTNEAQELVTPIEQHKRVDRFDQRYRVYVSPDRVDKTEFNSRSPEYYAARNFEYRGRNYMFNTTAEQLGITDAPPLYEVTDVEDAGTREMYDIELAGPHEYVVGGLVSHNTVNAPNDSTIEDAKDVFEYIYEHGGKGVTYYRDGTRSKQVLTTRADNTDFADMDVEEVIAQIEAVFGGIEAFLEDDDVQAVVDDEIEALVEVADGDYEAFAKKRPRPDVLHGVTQRIDTGYGKLYVNINEDPEAERPFELFANIGNSGGFTASFTEALAKTISTAMRAGVDPGEIADELQGIRSPKVAWDKGEQIQSIPDAIGTAMRRYLDGDIERAYPQQQTLEETADEDRETAEAEMRSTDSDTTAAPSEPTEPTGDQQELIENGESPECPECGSMSLYYSEGCKTCESCGWSEC